MNPLFLSLLLTLPVEPEVHLAIVGARVLPVSGPVIEGGTVIVRGEKIEAVGKDLPLPPGIEVVRAEGKWLTPGLIESHTQLGTVEIATVPETVDSGANFPELFHAALRMEDAINPRSSLVAVARRHGVTSAVVTPTGGFVAGRSAWFDLGAPEDARALIRGPIAMYVSFGETGAAAAGASRAAAILRLSEALDDARLYRKQGAAFEKNGLRKLAASRLDLEALLEVIDQKLPLVVEARRASDIQAALRFAEREHLRLVLEGAEEGWLVKDELAKAKVPVMLNPLSNLPGRIEQLGARPDNAALLAAAGVKLILTTDSSHNASGLRFHLGNAVRAGLPHAAALAAATQNPAEVFSPNTALGALGKGRLANLVVWTGDPFEPASFAELVLVHGKRQELETRQTQLRQKYQARLGL
ncbi:MAG: amidohydrolase family protein [Myxococcota bacterium]